MHVVVCADCGKQEVDPIIWSTVSAEDGGETTYCATCFEKRYGTRLERENEIAAVRAVESRDVDGLIAALADFLRTINRLRATLREKDGAA